MSATTVTPTEMKWVTIKSQLPSLPLRFPSEQLTKRLILRPTVESDANALHDLSSQPEVAKWSSFGVLPSSLDITRERLLKGLANEKTVKIAICLRETGEMIGTGGCYRRDGIIGWPALTYSFRVEAWGKGYGTEFLTAFLEVWWTLPRGEVELIKVDDSTVFGEGEVKDECVTCFTTESNVGSQRVMEKSGMKLVKIWSEKDLAKPDDDDCLITLMAYEAKRS